MTNAPKLPTNPMFGGYNVKKQENSSNKCQNKPDEFISNDRFDQLSRNPETGINDKKSTIEAVTILQAEHKSLVINPRRPDLNAGEPNLDFVVSGPGNYKFVDVKNPIDPSTFPTTKEKTETVIEMAKRMGKKIARQKGGSDDVLHIVDMEKFPSDKKTEFIQGLIEGAGGPDHINFIN